MPAQFTQDPGRECLTVGFPPRSALSLLGRPFVPLLSLFLFCLFGKNPPTLLLTFRSFCPSDFDWTPFFVFFSKLSAGFPPPFLLQTPPRLNADGRDFIVLEGTGKSRLFSTFFPLSWLRRQGAGFPLLLFLYLHSPFFFFFLERFSSSSLWGRALPKPEITLRFGS